MQLKKESQKQHEQLQFYAKDGEEKQMNLQLQDNELKTKLREIEDKMQELQTNQEVNDMF